MTPDDILVTDQVAIVTGGGAGLGGAIARTLAAFGADVVVAEIDADRGEAAVRDIEATGRAGLFVPTDASDEQQVEDMVAAAHERFGRIDVLVNNVGGVRGQRFLDQSSRSRRKHVDLNLMSMFTATAAAAPHMVAGGRGGSIINIASIEALRAAPEYAVYAACKAAMTNFSRTMAVELGEHGIRVNTLAPDMIATPGLRGLFAGPVPDPLPDLPGSFAEGAARYVPLGREGVGDDIAGVAVFLASNLGRYVSGTTISVDGGTWASSGWIRTEDGEGWQLFDR